MCINTTKGDLFSMFFDNETNSCCIYCSCGCENGVLFKGERDEDFGYFISLVSDNFYVAGLTPWTRFKEKCKRIWAIIRNKEYTYFNSA